MELAARRAHGERRARRDMVVEVVGRQPRRHVGLPGRRGLAFDADAVVAIAGAVGQRIGAHQRLRLVRDGQPEGQELTGQEVRQGPAVLGHEVERRDGLALRLLAVDHEPAEALSQVLRDFRLGQSFLERPLPPVRKGRDRQGASRALQVILLEEQELVDLPDRHALGISAHGLDRIARADLALLQDAEVEAHPATLQEPVLEAGEPHLDGQLVAGDAGL